MPKIKLTLTATLEFEPDPALYPPDASLNDIRLIEVAQVEMDPHLFIEHLAANLTVTAEVLPEPEPAS